VLGHDRIVHRELAGQLEELRLGSSKWDNERQVANTGADQYDDAAY
jgi:hypothetical protein